MIQKIWNNRHILGSLIPSIYFNFHYLPFKVAMKLPILLYKPKFLKLQGYIKLQGKIQFGMIRLGFPTVSLYPNIGISIENHGGIILFKGKCRIGNNSFI